MNAATLPGEATNPLSGSTRSRRAFLIAAGSAAGLALSSGAASAGDTAAARESISGKYKVLACQLKGRWLPPQIWSSFVWEISETTFILHNHNVCPEAFVGSFVHCARGKIAMDASAGRIDFMPASGLFEGKTLKGTFRRDDSGQILQLVVAFPGGPAPRAYKAGPGEVYEVWQRMETAWGSY